MTDTELMTKMDTLLVACKPAYQAVWKLRNDGTDRAQVTITNGKNEVAYDSSIPLSALRKDDECERIAKELLGLLPKTEAPVKAGKP